ncbi:MAG TPA: DUF1788 domain-containing protein [Thermodesulfobacteriota bacterium]|nr:DUF1788 domain-containing protein [Thermodesulfobacteriota bacterium]
MSSLKNRLNQILPRITSDEFLKSKGLGNEIAFYIFDYPPEEEMEVRKHIQFVLNYLKKNRPELKVKHINLFSLLVDYLKSRNLLERALQIQKTKGDKELLKALKLTLDGDKIARVFIDAAEPQTQDLVIISGVGNAWPLIRSHNLLNNLHSHMGKTPLIMFYPGMFTGNGLRLFGRLKESNYYRAFKLVP